MSNTILKHPRQLIEWYLSIGSRGLSDNEKSKRTAFNAIMLIGFLTVLGFTAFYAIYDFEGLRVAWVASIICGSIVLLPFVAIYSLRLALYLGLLVGIWVFCFLTYHLGAGTGLFFFMNVGLVSAFVVNGRDNLFDSVVFGLLFTVAMVVCAIFFQEPSGSARIDPHLQTILSVGVAIGLPMMLGVGLLVLSDRVARAEQALALEHARSEALLDNLLPAEITARLKSSPRNIIADSLPEVTIMFVDIVGFTHRASSMRADELVIFLNQIFTEFDKLVEEFEVEKIKTIGDAYMVAAGMPTARPDHAQIIADLSLAVLRVTERIAKKIGQHVGVRIGLHSGAAVAGVIGTQKVFYDVWGDTVNTASRLESHGEEGRIQLTEETKNRLGPAYSFELRGEVEIKGKGEVRTYWLTGKV